MPNKRSKRVAWDRGAESTEGGASGSGHVPGTNLCAEKAAIWLESGPREASAKLPYLNSLHLF